MTDILAPVVGPISGAVAEAAQRYIRSGAPYHCAIAGLPFQMEPSPNRPYARETADYRAQQIDTSPTVGDQSLVGWWTRGQLSFHRGEGVPYYETLDGEGVLNRYTTGANVNPWTLGSVQLAHRYDTIHTGQVSRAAGAGDTIVYLMSAAGELIRLDLTDNSTTIVHVSGVTDVYPAGGFAVYVHNGAVKTIDPSGASTTIATLNNGSFVRAWWGKDRIWARSNAGDWFTIANTPAQSIDAGDAFWRKDHYGQAVAFAAGPGPVYVSAAETVYAITLDVSGSVPSVNPPIEVARMPYGENVIGLGWAVGHLVIQTWAGVRVAAESGSGLLLGPRIVDDLYAPTLYSTSIATRGDIVTLVGKGLDQQFVQVELNMAEFVDDLRPAYAHREADLGSTTGHGFVGCGAILTGFDTELVYGAFGVRRRADSLVDSGWLLTGQHRMGTLESKSFRTVTVRAEGRGSIAVSRVDADGAVTPLATLSEDLFGENEISLSADRPRTSIGLRFDLIRDPVSGEGPRLLGYQLRALPAPQRQRLIQVPLMCRDIERVGSGEYGHKGWAWQRLRALEELERTSRVVTWQDFVTGESELVSIERLQYQSMDPVDAGSKSHPGHIMLTMRVVN